MATDSTAAGFGPSDLRDDRRLAELLERHRRTLAYALIAVLLALAGYWLYARSKAIKEQRADAAYQAAVQSAAAGNLPLAQAELKKVAVRYAGTNGGAAAAMGLAKISYQQGKWQEGISALRATAERGGDMQYDARMLLGAGYEGLKQPAQAVRVYEDAAKVARFPADRFGALAMAARTAQLAGDRTTAIRLWSELLKDPASGYEAEARVRLGELQAQPIKA